MTMYRVWARFIPTGKISSIICDIAGVNAISQHPLWSLRAIEEIEIQEDFDLIP